MTRTQAICQDARIPAQLSDGWDSPELFAIKTTLPNGVRVILSENHTVPLVFLSWTSQAGFESDPRGLEGLAAFTPLLLREGTAHRSGSRITEEVDDLGADLVAGCSWDYAFLNLELLSQDLAAGAELLIDMVSFAQFPAAAVARLRHLRLADFERRRRRARTLADDEFARVMYGATTYGRSPFGTAASLQRIEAADVAAFHGANYRPATSYLALTGDFDSDLVADLLGSFTVQSSRIPNQLPPTPFAAAAEPAAGIRLVDVPHATQTEIRVGHAGVARDSQDLPRLEVLNAVLGGGPSSRLSGSLRQRLGLTYHVRSRFAARRRGGLFVVETTVANEAARAAIAAVCLEIERLREEPVPADELERAKLRLLGAELKRFQSIVDTGATLAQVALKGDPVRHFQFKRRAIAAVTPDALRELACRYLHPERLVSVVVGPATALQSQFSTTDETRCRSFPLESIS